MYNFNVKRLMDLLLVVPLLVVCLPVMGAIWIAIWAIMGPPVIFRQERPGYKGKSFKIYKFRTMAISQDNKTNTLSDAQRLTSLGRFLRSTSLDELPELINVLKGDMSLVGPRPLLPQYLARYSTEQSRRHDVKPGLTGWAQVNGRNAISWEDKFKFDLWYIDNWSIGLDIKIILMTLWKIIKVEGINQPGQATAKEFMGDEENGKKI